MNIAIVGCGFVADYYLLTLPNHPELQLLGVMDRNDQRAQSFAEFHSASKYDSLDQLLSDDRVDLVLNLTNGQTLQDITGSGDSDDWTSRRICLYHEKNVMYAGKRTGGIRIRPVEEVEDSTVAF